MLISRARPLLRAIKPSQVAMITRSYELDTSYHRFPSFNDLPQPEGSWKEKYDREQAQYNGILAASIAAFVATIAYLKTSEVLFLNWAPPVHWE